MQQSKLSQIQRAKVLKKLSEIVEDNFYDPVMRGVDWAATVAKHRDSIINASNEEQFELEVNDLLLELRSSHVGFFRDRPKRSTAKMAISSSYSSASYEGHEHWVFQNVHEGGPASNAGLQSGDILLSVDGREFRPPEHPIFPLDATVEVQVLTSGLKLVTRELILPPPVQKRFQLPYVQPTLVVQRRLRDDIGYIRISMFPGMVGLEVANEISAAIESLNPIERLIIDLRGNTGGGVAVVRVMSLLTSKRLPIGYSMRRSQLGFAGNHDSFPVFEKIPSQKADLKLLALKFGWRLAASELKWPVKPLLLKTEGLQEQPFHDRVVLLVDRHTASASEMIVAFARENGLALLVGEATSGRLLSGSSFSLPAGYKVALPVGAYRTARDWVLEGSPITPDVEVPFAPELAREGRDTQLDKAIEVVSDL